MASVHTFPEDDLKHIKAHQRKREARAQKKRTSSGRRYSPRRSRTRRGFSFYQSMEDDFNETKTAG